jgi:hypothetical protein
MRTQPKPGAVIVCVNNVKLDGTALEDKWLGSPTTRFVGRSWRDKDPGPQPRGTLTTYPLLNRDDSFERICGRYSSFVLFDTGHWRIALFYAFGHPPRPGTYSPGRIVYKWGTFRRVFTPWQRRSVIVRLWDSLHARTYMDTEDSEGQHQDDAASSQTHVMVCTQEAALQRSDLTQPLLAPSPV